jgi:hypothetical protein
MPLRLRLGFVDVETQESPVQVKGFRARQHHHAWQPFGQPPGGCGKARLPASNQQRGRQKERFSFTQQGDLIQVRPHRRKVVRAQFKQLEANPGSGKGRNILLALFVVAAKQKQSTIGSQHPNGFGGDRLVFFGDPLRKWAALQPGI